MKLYPLENRICWMSPRGVRTLPFDPTARAKARVAKAEKAVSALLG